MDWRSIAARAGFSAMTSGSTSRPSMKPTPIVRAMRRARATGINIGNTLFLMLWFIGCIELEKVHPLQGGYFRRKYRRDRRPGLPFENPLVFYPRYVIEQIVKHVRMIAWVVHYERIRRSIKHDPNAGTTAMTRLNRSTSTSLTRMRCSK
jgi:hypothetical protein